MLSSLRSLQMPFLQPGYELTLSRLETATMTRCLQFRKSLSQRRLPSAGRATYSEHVSQRGIQELWVYGPGRSRLVIRHCVKAVD